MLEARLQPSAGTRSWALIIWPDSSRMTGWISGSPVGPWRLPWKLAVRRGVPAPAAAAAREDTIHIYSLFRSFVSFVYTVFSSCLYKNFGFVSGWVIQIERTVAVKHVTLFLLFSNEHQWGRRVYAWAHEPRFVWNEEALKCGELTLAPRKPKHWYLQGRVGVAMQRSLLDLIVLFLRRLFRVVGGSRMPYVYTR